METPITCNITVQDGNSTKEVETTDCPSKFSDLKGDGICNDALNNIAYNYDDGDCCSESSRFGQPYCVECECKVPNVIHFKMAWKANLKNNTAITPLKAGSSKSW